MPHVAVEQRRSELRHRQRFPEQPREDLAQPEQFEVVEQEGAEQQHTPAGPEQHLECDSRRCLLDVPDDRRGDRPPLPEHQGECESRSEHIGAALDRLRHQACPPALERRPRHHAVLHAEQGDQQQVHDHGLVHGPGQATVDRLRQQQRQRQVADEADQEEEGCKEERVRDNAVQHHQESGHIDLQGSDKVAAGGLSPAGLHGVHTHRFVATSARRPSPAGMSRRWWCGRLCRCGSASRRAPPARPAIRWLGCSSRRLRRRSSWARNSA